jgi:hypothetical protein
VEQALALGIDLPDDLPLWALAGGRPTALAAPGEPDELGALLEAANPPAARRQGGVHYTPASLAAELVERAIGRRSRPSIGDPACGGGALLLAAARHQAARGEAPTDIVTRLWGMDIDPLAVATTEVALLLWARSRPPTGQITVGDALAARPSAWPSLDVVVGNPPFLSQLDAATARDAAVAARHRSRFGDVVRAYTDDASLFLLAACDLAAPGGRVVLLQPQSVLGARDAAGVRTAVSERGQLVDVWFPAQAGFEAAVDVCAPIIDVGAGAASSTWSRHLAVANGVPAVELHDEQVLGAQASVTAAFRSEYYGMVDHVHEHDDRPSEARLVTTGLIDLGGCAWGQRPARIGGRTWQAPVIETGALEGRAAEWARRTRVPKLVVATQTRVLEVAVDEDGEWIAGVPLVVVLAELDRLWGLAAALASPAVSAWLLARVAGTGMTRQSLKVTAPLLREVPMPTDADAWAFGTAAFRDGDMVRFVEAMSAAYGTDAGVAAWWSERARTVWSPSAARR